MATCLLLPGIGYGARRGGLDGDHDHTPRDFVIKRVSVRVLIHGFDGTSYGCNMMYYRGVVEPHGVT